MAVDFPKAFNIEHDFLGVFVYENNQLNILAFPYNVYTGEMYQRVENAKILKFLRRDINMVIQNQIQALYN